MVLFSASPLATRSVACRILSLFHPGHARSRAGLMVQALLALGFVLAAQEVTAAANQPPVNTMPASFTTNEDTPLSLAGLSIADPDAAAGSMSVTLTVGSGTLTATTGGGVTVSGASTATLVLTGTLANINTFLAGAGTRPTFTPAADANGSVTLSMTTNDNGNTGTGGPLSDVDSRTITVTAVNDAPRVFNDSYTVYNTGVAQRLPSVLANDRDVEDVTGIDNNTLTITAFTATSANGGTLTYNNDGTFNYLAAANFTGSDQFTYTASDGALTTVGTVFLTVAAKADAVNDAASTNEETPVTIPVLGNDSDPDSGPLNITQVNGTAIVDGGAAVPVTNGTVALVSGNLVFTPATDVTGAVSFTYTLTDGNPPTNVPYNQLQAQSLTFSSWTSATAGTLAGNAITETGSTAGGPYSYSTGMPAPHNTTLQVLDVPATWAGSRTLTFATPITASDRVILLDVDNGENATLTFYDAGGAVVDPSGFRTEMWQSGTAITTGSNLVRSASSIVITGTGASASDPAFVFTPNAAIKSIVITSTGSGSGTSFEVFFAHESNPAFTPATDVATVTVNVAAVNDPPFLDLDGTSASTNLITNGHFSGGSSANWTSGYVASPPSGPISFSNAQNSPLTTAPAGASATGAVYIYVDNDGNIGSSGVVLQNTTPLSLTNGTTYTFSVDMQFAVDNVYAANYHWVLLNASNQAVMALTGNFTTGGTGADVTATTMPWGTWQQKQLTFVSTLPTGTYTVGIAWDTPAATNGNADDLLVDRVYLAPEPTSYATTFTENGAGAALAAATDQVTDVDNANMTAATITLTNPQTGDRLLVSGSAAASGTLGSGIAWTRTDNLVTLSGSYTKAQYAAALQLVQFECTADMPNTAVVRDITGVVNDGTVGSNTAHTYVTVVATNDAPVANDDSFTLVEDATITGQDLTSNDSDVDNTNAQLTWSLVSGGTAAANGTVTVNANGTFSYVPASNFTGTVSFTYQACDLGPLCDPATVTITVTPVNDPPVVALGANLVINGSFENATVWGGNAGLERNVPGTYGVPAAPNGSVVCEVEGAILSPTTTPSYIAQTINTVVGQTYLFSVQAVNRVNANTGDRGYLSVAGTNVLSFTTTNTWSTYAVVFTATATTTDIRIISNGSATGGTLPGDGSGLIVDDVQVVPVTYSTTFTENGAGVALASANDAVYDVDNTNMTGATITLTNPQTADRLLVNGSAAASGTLGSGITWTRTDNLVTLSGSFSKAQYAAALQLVQFQNTSDDPNTAVVRDITMAVNDGTAGSNTAHAYVTVIAVNDAPVNTVPGPRTMPEDGTLTFSTANGNAVQVADEAGTLTVTLWCTQGTLALNGTTGLALLWNTSSALQFSGTQADINAALNGLVYTPSANNDGSSSVNIRTVDSGGLSDLDAVAIDLTPVTDAFNDAVSVAAGSSITIDPRTNDTFGPNGFITAISAPTNGTAALNAGSMVTYSPYAGYTGTDAFTYTTTTIDAGFNVDYWTYNAVDGGTYAATFPSGFPASASNGISWTPGISGAASNVVAMEMNDPDASTTVRWNGVFLVTTAGTYTFTQSMDNAGRFIIDGVVRLTSGYSNGTVSTSLALSAGLHSFIVEFGDVGGNENCVVTWSGADTGGSAVDISASPRWGAAARTETATVNITVTSASPLVALMNNNLVSNSSFESGTTGWSGNSGVEVNPVSSYGVPTAPDGSKVMEVEYVPLSPTSTPSYVAQTINTVVGRTYIYSIQAVNRINANTGDMGFLSVAGVNMLNVRLTNTWTTYAVQFTATSATTEIRITSTGSVSGSYPLGGDANGFIVDDVQVREVNYSTSFTENGAGVVLSTATPFVYDVDNANMSSAAITLTNPQPGDRLLVNGSAAASGTLGSGIAWTRTDNLVTLSGSFTKAQYAAALPLMQFQSTSDDPGTTTRDVTMVVNDGTSNSNAAHAYITVIPVNDAPVAIDDDSGTNKNVSISGFPIRNNDSDVDNTAAQLNWSLVSGGTAAAHGTLTVNANGTFDFVPAHDYVGLVNFTYQVCDGGPLCATAQVSILIISPLPVELLSFDGKNDGQVDHLYWSTASERDCDRFEVERSTDAVNFTRIGSTPGAGTSQHRVDYTFDDRAPITGVNYYRLKQVDTDGAFEYSPIIALLVDEVQGSVGQVTLLDPAGMYLIGNELSDQVRVDLLNSAGQVVPGAAWSSGGRCYVDLRGQAAGMYVARVVDGERVSSYKLLASR